MKEMVTAMRDILANRQEEIKNGKSSIMSMLNELIASRKSSSEVQQSEEGIRDQSNNDVAEIKAS